MSNMKNHLLEFDELKAENARLRADNERLKRLASGDDCPARNHCASPREACADCNQEASGFIDRWSYELPD